jgi:hypothetical protein
MLLVYHVHCWVSRMRAGGAPTAVFSVFLLLTA